MDLDLRTLSVVVAVAYVLQTLALALLYSKNKKYAGLLWWVIGNGLTAIGFILFLARDFIQILLVSIILPNALVISGALCIYIGIMRFLDRRENRKLVFSVFAFFIVLYFYFTYANNDINSRTVIVSAALAFYLFLTTRELVGKTPKAIADSSQLIAVILFSEGCFFVFRTLSVLTFAPVENLFTPTLIQTMVFVVYFVGGILLTFGLIIMVNQRDITERKKSEEALRESENRYRSLFETMLEGFAFCRMIYNEQEFPVDFIYLNVNPAFDRIIGTKTVIGKRVTEVFPGIKEAFPQLFEIYGRVALTGQPESFEIDFKPSEKWLHVSVTSPVKEHFVAIFEDITVRKQAELGLVQKNENLRELNEELTATQEELHQNIEELGRSERVLRESEVKFRSMVEDVKDYAIIILDPTGKVVSWNAGAERIVGYTANEIMGRDFSVFFPPEETQDQDPREELRVAASEGRFELQGWKIRKDGSRFWADILTTPLRDEQNNLIGYSKIFRDLTNRKNAEETILQKNEELGTLNEELTASQEELRQNIEELTNREHQLSTALAEKEVLLSEIHHRVKNNLTAFISLLSLEGSTEETPSGKQLKQDLQNRARSMALIHETLYKTQMYNDVDMGVYLTNLLDQIANTFRTSQSVKIIVSADRVLLDIPRGTPAGLIINELVTNSFKYAFPESFDVQAVRGEPPTISVVLSKNEGMFELKVKDNGIGLPPGFDLAKTQTLGLKLVNFLAKHQMRAKIEVRSTDGTEYIFRFKE